MKKKLKNIYGVDAFSLYIAFEEKQLKIYCVSLRKWHYNFFSAILINKLQKSEVKKTICVVYLSKDCLFQPFMKKNTLQHILILPSFPHLPIPDLTSTWKSG